MNVLTQGQIDLLAHWEQAKQNADFAIEAERELRAQVIEQIFATAKDDGTTTVKLANNYKIQLVRSATLAVVQEDIAGNPVDYEAKLGAVMTPAEYSEVIKHKPSVSKASFKLLAPEKQQQLLTEGLIEVKASAGTVKIVAPTTKTLEER
jgi:hypothetical protein